MRRSVPFVLVVLALGTAACASSAPSSSTQVADTRIPLPAGRLPSPIATMVCSDKAQRELGDVLGTTAEVQTPTWTGHLYSCRYRYATGTMVLSVKELSSWTQTFGYYATLRRQLGDAGSLGNLGQGAFTTGDGSIVVRKDWKVLTVDISGLPAQFGVPPTSRGDIADTVADVILGCWAGD